MKIDTDYRPGIDVNLTLDGDDMDTLLNGKKVEDRYSEVYVTVRMEAKKLNPSGGHSSESPLDYLKRTWHEPRYSESASDHSARLARGVN